MRLSTFLVIPIVGITVCPIAGRDEQAWGFRSADRHARHEASAFCSSPSFLKPTISVANIKRSSTATCIPTGCYACCSAACRAAGRSVMSGGSNGVLCLRAQGKGSGGEIDEDRGAIRKGGVPGQGGRQASGGNGGQQDIDQRQGGRGQQGSGGRRRQGSGGSRRQGSGGTSGQVGLPVELLVYPLAIKKGDSRPYFDGLDGIGEGVHSDSLYLSEEEGIPAGEGTPQSSAEEGYEGEVESYWIDYAMRVPCEVPRATTANTLDTLTALERQLECGDISPEAFSTAKASLSKQFWDAVVDERQTARAFTTKDIKVQVSNSAQFVDAWVRINVLDKRAQTLGLSVEWNSGARVKGGRRHRISVLQVATESAVLIVRLSELRPLKLPPLLQNVLEDVSVRKVGNAILQDAVKLAKDWGVEVLGRVDAHHRATDFGYLDGFKNSKGVSALARGVLSLDYEPPNSVSLGNWESETLSNLQLSCASLDAWVPLQALSHVETELGYQAAGDIKPAGESLAYNNAPAYNNRGPQSGRPNFKSPDSAIPGRREEAGRSTREGPADLELFLPKIDVRQGGWCSYWVWRGTRVSQNHIGRYCDVEVEVEEHEDFNRVLLWGQEANVWEATVLIKKLLSRSQLDEQYIACGLSVAQFVDRVSGTQVSSTAIINTPEVVAWSFFPRTLTQTFLGEKYWIRGSLGRKDRERAAFFAQADAAANAAEDLLGPRPGVIIGPLPAGLDPSLMWQITKYNL